MLLELSLHAINLKNVAGTFRGTSDPFAVVTNMSGGDNKSTATVLGKTEVIKNTLNPQWVTSFTIDYTLGSIINVIVSVFDHDGKGKHISMGSVVFEIGEVLGARGNTKAKKIAKSTGTIYASVREQHGKGLLRLKLKGTKLKNTEGMMSKSDPFYELCRNVNHAGGLTWDNVYRSPTIKNSLEPAWDTAVIELSKLCGGDLNLPIRINVYDYEKDGKHVLMGVFETSVNGLIKASNNGNTNDTSKAFTMAAKVGGKETGKMIVVQAEVHGIEEASVTQKMATMTVSPAKTPPVAGGKPSFVDYVSGGCQLNVVVAIDFTGSNGDPRKVGTLHYHDKSSMNDYEKAISAIVGVLSKYDDDQHYPVYGFGAKYDGVVNHCFLMSENAYQVQGILDAYDNVFKTGFIMSSPTVFTEVIEAAANRAKQSQAKASASGRQAYTILLIVTDGAVTDPQATASCLNRICEDCPLSIVIVGVGTADFTSMHFLDNKPNGMKRDVAQFVEFNKHSANKSTLTEATLCEIPTQLVEYYYSCQNIMPNPPQKIEDKDVTIVEEEDIDFSIDFQEEGDIVVHGERALKPEQW